MIKRIEIICTLLIGGVGYGICELLWRGYTHWTMVLLGGVCFAIIYEAEKKYKSLPLYIRCVCGGILISSLELLTGSIVNIALGMNVWDYSGVPFNFLGQVCLPFLLLWIFICVPALPLCDYIARHLNKIYL